MFTRESASREVYAEVVRRGVNAGHSVNGCSHEVICLEFVADYPSASTTGGLIDAVREYGSSATAYGFAHICCLGYLRELFPEDVLADFMLIGAEHPIGGPLLRYCIGELPDQVDLVAGPLTPELEAAFDASVDWSSVRGV